jgi:hypothetical protein
MEKVLELTHSGVFDDHIPLKAARFAGFAANEARTTLLNEQILWLDQYFKFAIKSKQYLNIVINSYSCWSGFVIPTTERWILNPQV